MNKPIHPAVAEHVMSENERLRGLLMSVLNTPRGTSGRIILEPDEEAAIRAALSQQTGPECVACEDKPAAGNNPCAVCGKKTESAPAQDEREAAIHEVIRFCRLVIRSVRKDGEYSPVSMQTPDEVEALLPLLATRPAQTEQHPIYQIRPRENVRDWLDTNADGYRAAKAMTSMEARVLYAAPIAQTAPVDALEHVSEGAEMLQSMIDNIESKGNYSRESTVLFLNQALGCIRAALSAQGGV